MVHLTDKLFSDEDMVSSVYHVLGVKVAPSLDTS